MLQLRVPARWFTSMSRFKAGGFNWRRGMQAFCRCSRQDALDSTPLYIHDSQGRAEQLQPLNQNATGQILLCCSYHNYAALSRSEMWFKKLQKLTDVTAMQACSSTPALAVSCSTCVSGRMALAFLRVCQPLAHATAQQGNFF